MKKLSVLSNKLVIHLLYVIETYSIHLYIHYIKYLFIKYSFNIYK